MDAFLYAANCHCSRCRAATGSAFKSFAGIERTKLEITKGRDNPPGLRRGRPERHALWDLRLPSFSVVRNGDYVHVAMGSLVVAPSVRPTEHIFVGSKAPWFEITDDLPQSEENE